MGWLADRLKQIMGKSEPKLTKSGYHDSDNDCPTNASHRGMRAREVAPDMYMLVCADCGDEIRLANPFRGVRANAKS